MQSLQERKALITGAGSGIGQAVAKRLAEEGVHVALVGRTEDKLLKTASLLEAYEVNVVTEVMDVGEAKSVEAAVDRIKASIGDVDIVINNAGAGKSSPFLELTESDWEDILNVNVKGVFRVTQAVLPGMIENNRGDIVNIASTSGLRGTKGSSVYSASKFALRGLSEALMQEMRPHNIRVQTINPSKVITGFGGSEPEENTEDAFMQAEDVADVIVSQLMLHPRMFVKQSELWATNPR
ncbi:3-ketoacyl-ACP reductase [Geomicrobium sp. JCM 19039]|uniref:3-ketoacyl-ACP reductase n=1 Tax=Geomicrobium sp. JCM 19039 TaxID=1460636 RepID=UPI00045F2F89|nr:3-ketoacyl-ACP reductase [Geomicrobium sp. JCM 19039]GAK10576.1 3-oxoacyl-[acyl-carrier protein] reductase [Geomicrobium sp. JCM 19039]